MNDHDDRDDGSGDDVDDIGMQILCKCSFGCNIHSYMHTHAV